MWGGMLKIVLNIIVGNYWLVLQEQKMFRKSVSGMLIMRVQGFKSNGMRNKVKYVFFKNGDFFGFFFFGKCWEKESKVVYKMCFFRINYSI